MIGKVTLIAILVAFLSTFILSHWFIHSQWSGKWADHPNGRSLHNIPVPRTGGVAIFVGILLGIALYQWLSYSLPQGAFLLWSTGLIPLVIISFCDDLKSIRPQWRLLVHTWSAFCVVGGIVLLRGSEPLSLIEWCSYCVLLPLIVWMINLYNFMDGMDGFAGGMAATGFCTLAWLGRADNAFSSTCLIIAATSIAFLRYNFPPARLFLGDTGSTLLGFFAATCSLWGIQAQLFPTASALLVFSPFIVDASVTLLRRIAQREHILQPHRSHYYQRLVLLGWGHRRTVLVEYGLMVACATSAISIADASHTSHIGMLIFWLFLYGALIGIVQWYEQQKALATL